MNKIVGIIVVVVLIAVIAIWVPISIKNGLIAKDEHVNEAWAQIETQLQRRADLIPNLMNTVKGYAKHEKEIFVKVSEARAKLLASNTPASKAEASGALNSALGRLLAISENYPDLKANTNFIRLQDELAGTENRIAVARTRYNNSVKIYNASIRKFPGSFFASGMGLNKREYFNPPAGSNVEKVPEVKF